MLTLLMGDQIAAPVPQPVTDLGYLNQLAKANGYVCYLEPGPVPGMSRVYWGPEVCLDVPQHAINVNMDHLSTGTN